MALADQPQKFQMITEQYQFNVLHLMGPTIVEAINLPLMALTIILFQVKNHNNTSIYSRLNCTIIWKIVKDASSFICCSLFNILLWIKLFANQYLELNNMTDLMY